MVDLVARKGSVLGTVGSAPDGSAWSGSTYPKHFHAILTMLIETANGPFAVGTAPDPREYGVGLAILFIVMCLALSAGIVQIPLLQRRPSLAWPVVAFPVAGFVLGPGSQGISAGFPNFVLACVLVSLAACVAVTMPRVTNPLMLAALVGLVVATAHTWLLLLPLATAAAIVALAPWQRRRWRSTVMRRLLTFAILAAGVVGVGVAVAITLPSLNASTIQSGGSEYFPAALSAAMTTLSFALGGVLLIRNRRSRRMGTFVRFTWLALIPLVSTFLLALIGLQQVLATGSLSYYFDKLSVGALLTLLPIVGIQAAAIAHSLTRPKAIPTIVVVSLSGLLTILPAQLFGYIGPRYASVAQAAEGLHYRVAEQIVLAGDSPEATRLLDAAKVADREPFGTTVYVSGLHGDPQPYLANLWHLALSGTWSLTAEKRSAALGTSSASTLIGHSDYAPVVERLLAASSSTRVIVAPQIWSKIEQATPPAQRSRVVTW
jgi:hypothetical protein